MRFLWTIVLLITDASTFLPAAEPARVVIITPHNEAIRQEFGRAFAAWHEREFNQPAIVEWREMGGTSASLRFVRSEFAQKPEGIGVDLFFGGGLEPFLFLADQGFAEVYTPPPEILGTIPPQVAGVELYDPEQRWYGAAISSFGILQNLRVQRLAGLPPASRWEDLARPELAGWVAAGDPRNSGTMNVMFESFLQAYGWERGWQLIHQIGGNIREFDRISSTTARSTALGQTAYAFAIDFYGFTQVAALGKTNLTFALPDDFTAINPDGIALLKGAPNRVTAARFIDFTLGEPGQKLWFLPLGHAEGPQRNSIERMSVRPDFYERFAAESNIQFSPFKLRQSFIYDAALGRDRREVVATLVGALLVDPHDDLKKTWRSIIAAGLPAQSLAELGRMPITADEALELARTGWQDAAERNRKRNEWQQWAGAKYRRLR
ncbi:MAG TPA: ABC transporter substrate-binding protein [Verrucomicrobiae bacterium]|nr:ABC transporter substrate-binding protein [Verrucomicrobiae bacterium]